MIKKKIIIFTSAGGNGHMSVTRALIEMLETTYNISYVYGYNNVLEEVDFFNWLTRKKMCGEDIYNFCLQKKWIFAIHVLLVLGRCYFWLYRKKIFKLLQEYLKQEKPNLIISVMPFINGALAQNAASLNIPFLIIPTDLDATTFVSDVSKVLDKKFKIAIAFEDQDLMKKIPQNLRNKYVAITGFPIRKNFFDHKDAGAIKEKWDVPVNKKIILVMMGGQGSLATFLFAEQLAHLKMAAHIILCIGNFTLLEKKIKSLRFPEHISFTIVTFTESIADLMAVADLIITKSGTVSFCEALYIGKPILLDGTSSVLLWEKFNHTFIQKHALGDIIYNLTDTARLVEKILLNEQLAQEYSKNSFKMTAHNPNSLLIKNVINEMI